jgi:hypothetical protein
MQNGILQGTSKTPQTTFFCAHFKKNEYESHLPYLLHRNPGQRILQSNNQNEYQIQQKLNCVLKVNARWASADATGQ